MLSPVCTPIGSIFSMQHIIIALSLQSLITSISNSFQPNRDSSMRTSPTGLAINPDSICVLKSSILYAVEPPVPPKVNEGRIITGKPILSIAFIASSIFLTNPPFAVGIFTSSIAFLNDSLFSAFSIELIFAPKSFILYLSKIPFLYN